MKTTIYKNSGAIGLLLALAASWFATGSCQKYLDARPDKSLEIPSTLQDYQAIMDAKPMSADFPFAGDIASDYYYLPYNTWKALSTEDYRNDYVWGTNPANDLDWQYMYGVILKANIVIGGTNTLARQGGVTADLRQVMGSAYFFRGYCYYQLANVFTLPYSAAISGDKALGLPLHLSADITAPTARTTLAGTYAQIISDLKTSAAMLPVTPLVKTRPSKSAAYGALARTYLAMGDYRQAGLYADSALQLYHTLIDYNTVSPATAVPFPLFNDEVIFHTTTSGRGAIISPAKAIADSNLYASYDANDLRKTRFFKLNSAHLPVFKGDYGGATSSILFNGIATDELYLTRAECAARNNDLSAAVNDVNTLLQNRYATGSYVPYDTGLSADSALSLVLKERRKELAFRSELRWADLRRLSGDPRFAVTPVRSLDGTIYTLPPGDKRYAFLLPVSVVQISGIPQNAR
jgi:starch-binding outer membrane protein, SusD/RagB family